MCSTWTRLLALLLGLAAVMACSAPATQAPAAPPTTAAAPTTAPKPAATAPPAAAPTTAPTVAAVAKPTTVPAAAPTVSANTAAPVSGEIVVFAASSLTDVFQDMANAFQQSNPSAKVTFNFGASSQLATQLAQSASADVFASADQTQMDNARKSNAVVGQDRVFARNRLVVITPKDNPKKIVAVRDLANDGVKLVTAQTSVPIGQYTEQMLDKASTDPTYASDFKSKVEANTVSKEDNVRQVVSKVQLGEADAAVVYSTDATPQVRDQLQLIQVPDPLQTLATYPIAVAKGANSAGGEAFVSHVLGSEGQATLAKWGFLPPTSATAQPAAAAQRTPPSSSGGVPAAAAPVPAVASRHVLADR
jgi:molybdate transport system substrate-binding protein